eukprot:g2723.t1
MKRLFQLDSSFHGHGAVEFAWQSAGNYLATAGTNGILHIFDRRGTLYDKCQLQGKKRVTHIDWDYEGECVAVIQENSSVINLYHVRERKSQTIETTYSALTFMKWSHVGPHLAAGSKKGHLLIYRKDLKRKQDISGAHSKAIKCGCWTDRNVLLMGSADKTVSACTADGELLSSETIKLDGEPLEISVQPSDPSEKEGSDVITYSVNVGGKHLLIDELQTSTKPQKSKFSDKYGYIVRMRWYNHKKLVIAFNTGRVIVVSKDTGFKEEDRAGRFHKSQLNDVECSLAIGRAASCGGTSIKVIDFEKWEVLKKKCVSLKEENGVLSQIKWTEDGYILSVSSTSGYLYTFLVCTPTINATFLSSVAYMSSLQEMSIVDVMSDDEPASIKVDIEPAFIGLGPTYAGIGMNNRVWFYELRDYRLFREEEYAMGTLREIKLNSKYAAVRSSNKIKLHYIENEKDPSSYSFPENSSFGITCMGLSENHLIYATSLNGGKGAVGSLHFYSLEDKEHLSVIEYHHEGAEISKLYPNTLGTRVIFTDTVGNGYIFHAADNSAMEIPDLPSNVTSIIWDNKDPNLFVAISKKEYATYLYARLTTKGPIVKKLGRLTIDKYGTVQINSETMSALTGHVPIALSNGVLTCQLLDGTLSEVVLKTHKNLFIPERILKDDVNAQLENFRQNLQLLRLNDAFSNLVKYENSKVSAHMQTLAAYSMQNLDIRNAIRVYRKLGDAGMVMSLEKLAPMEDRNLLSGHISLLFERYDEAQDYFLNSSNPITALDMRCDLMQWKSAMALAKQIDTSRVPLINLRLAKENELKNDCTTALGHYENAHRGFLKNYEILHSQVHGSNKTEALDVQGQIDESMCGIARCSILTGDLRRGIALAKESKNDTLCCECGQILQKMNQKQDAASLYEHGKDFEEAANIYISLKRFDMANRIMHHVTTPKTHGILAKAQEKLKQYKEAEASYEKANLMDDVVRINLKYLQNKDRAFEIARNTGSGEGVKFVAEYCKSHGIWGGAIEFLILAQDTDDAFAIAKENDCVEVFAQKLDENASESRSESIRKEFMRLAQYYESKGQLGQAAEFYSKQENYVKALRLFLRCGEDFLEQAIDVVGRARNETLTHTLIDYMIGETDGIPKERRYIYKLWMALGNYRQAAQTAIVIGRQEREFGNYKEAHSILLKTSFDLRRHNISVPRQLSNMLLLLHSQRLCKKHSSIKDHQASARLLIRLAQNISKFPKHAVTYLVNCVFECRRAKFKQEAFEYASMLMRPEYRNDIPQKYKKKIELIVRRHSSEMKKEREEASERLENSQSAGNGANDAANNNDPSGSKWGNVKAAVKMSVAMPGVRSTDETSKCPFCSSSVPIMEMSCGHCKNTIPYCIVTGQHMRADDWCMCPISNMPALYSHYVRYIENFKTDPMFEKPISVDDIK